MSKATAKIIKNCVPDGQLNYLVSALEFWDSKLTCDDIDRSEYFANGTGDFQVRSNNWPLALKDAIPIEHLMSAVGGLLFYLRTLKLDKDLFSAKNFLTYNPIRKSTSLVMDGQTLMNLEIFQNSLDGSEDGTLFKILNYCSTPFGKRLLKQWITHPLQDIAAINDRLDASDDINHICGFACSTRKVMSRLPDIERIIARIHTGSCKIKDFVSALESLQKILVLFY